MTATYEVEEITTAQANRGIFATDMQTLHTAILTFADGQSLHVSRWHDEDVWCADAHFGSNGFPHFCHGTGDRTVRKQTLSEDVVEDLELRL